MVILLKLMEVGENNVQVDVLKLQENTGWNPSLRSCIAMHCNIIWSGDQNQRQRAERQPSKCWHLGNIMSVRYFVFRIDNNFRALMRWLWTRIWRVNCQRQTLTRTALRDGQRYTADLCWRIPRTWSAKNYICTHISGSIWIQLNNSQSPHFPTGLNQFRKIVHTRVIPF